MDEEVVILEEQLAAAQADIDRLQSRLADSEARSATRDSELTEARRQLEAVRGQVAERDASLVSHVDELATTRGSLADAESRAREAAARYREAVLAHETDLPADLVAGDSIADIDEALTRARQTVAQVRQHLETRAQGQRIPAGAPARSAPDVSSLTPVEKIRLGLQAG